MADLPPDAQVAVGEQAAADLLAGIRNAREVLLPNTGHMFRFTHPDLYGRTVTDFVDSVVGGGPVEADDR